MWLSERARSRPPVLLVTALVVAVATGGVALDTVPDGAARVAVSLTVDATADRLTLVRHGGASVDPNRLAVVIRVDGRPLRHQPPVPFFAARGFRAGPTGPFNAASDPRWRAGERAAVTLAATNAPRIHEGDNVSVVLRVAGERVAAVSVRAR